VELVGPHGFVILIIASYAELGSAIPLAGGARPYLQRAFSPLIGFLFSWTVISVVKPASVALVSIMFAEYINRLLRINLDFDETSPVWAVKPVALVCIWMVIIFQSMGSRWGIVINNTFTAFKIATLFAISSIGLIVLGRL